MTDAATVSVLKEIAHSLKAQNRILEALNTNVVGLANSQAIKDEIVPRFLGWRRADELQRQGLLIEGDAKLTTDRKILIWQDPEWLDLLNG